MTKFPSEKELNKIRKELEKAPSSRMLPPGASSVDRLKFSLCEQFVSYLLETKLTQRELARKLKINEALVSKITHYQFDDFTIDRLVKYLTILHPDSALKITLHKEKAA